MRKGISLIVLSITILVMAILAATAIISLEDSGIIGRSKNTVSKQNQQEEYTRLQVIKNGILTDNLGEITADEYIIELQRQGLVEGSATTDEFGNKVIKTKSGLDLYVKQDGSSDIKISFEKIKPSLGELITAEDYGKTVDYEANGITKWKIFYHTSNYVYLIASEKLEYNKLPSNIPGATMKSVTTTLEDGTTRSMGQIYWASGSAPTTAGTIQNPSMWMASWTNYSTNINGRCVSYFLDETYWTAFKNTTSSYASYVQGAIGTPTLEMFVASWNAKGKAKNDTTTYKELVLTNGTYGYYINGVGTVRISSTDKLYAWSGASETSTWLASPSAGDPTYVQGLGYTASLIDLNYYITVYGVRPVVCLKASIPASRGTTTDFSLVK